MAVEDIVVDTFLQSVLDESIRSREQCIALLDQAESTSVSARDTPPPDTQLELSKQQKLLYSYLANLRGLNRNAILAVRDTKHATAEARSEIDRLHLQLQNLYYEQRHLRGEIHACESYE
jgi:THO complex subunit 5